MKRPCDSSREIFGEFRGLKTLLVFRTNGVREWWCGYVRLGPVDVDQSGLEVHGGITWDSHSPISSCDGSGFLTPPGEHWFGFDCSRYGDDPSIQDRAYVQDQVEKLVAQIEAQVSRAHYNTNAPHGAD